MQAKKENPFLKHLGPLPTDPPQYSQPADAKELEDMDPGTASYIRHQLAIRERKLREGGEA